MRAATRRAPPPGARRRPAEADPDLLWLKPHLARLRAKLEAAGGPAIGAMRSVGYRIEAAPTA